MAVKFGKHSYIGTAEALRARCRVEPTPRPWQWARDAQECWVWQGATSGGAPRIWTWCHNRQEKRVLAGSRAAWNIGRQAPVPGGLRVFMVCMTPNCVNPRHAQAMTMAAYGQLLRQCGRLVGSATEQRIANVRKAQVASRSRRTPEWKVQAILEAPPTTSGRELARRLAVGHATVCRVRLHRDHYVIPPPNVSAQAPMPGVA